MKRHHYIALGVLAAIALLVLLWPRHAGEPTTGGLPATDDPALNPDAPQGTDAPAVWPSVDAGGGRGVMAPDGTGAEPLVRDGGEQVQAPALPPGVHQATAVTEEQRQAIAQVDGGSDAKANAMHADPRMAAYRQGIKDAISRIKPKVGECYASALKQDPSIAGTIKITFEIKAVDGGGRVVSGEVPDSEIRSPFFEACVLEKVGGAEFPEPLEGGTVKVTYPFHFDPGGGWGGDPKDHR